MGSFPSGVGLLEIAAGIAEIGWQWLVQSTLVLAAGLAAASFLRSRGAAIQSAVYRTTLLTTLACPIVAYLVSFAGWSFVAVRLPELRVSSEELVLVPATLGQAAAVPVVETTEPIAALPAPASAPLVERAGPSDRLEVTAEAVPLEASRPPRLAAEEAPQAPLGQREFRCTRGERTDV